jgi:hypothetical protein
MFFLSIYGHEIWCLTLRKEHRLRMKNDVFWDVTPHGSCKNRCFGET